MYVYRGSNIDRYFTQGVNLHNYVISLGPGKMFGELGLLNNLPRSATIIT